MGGYSHAFLAVSSRHTYHLSCLVGRLRVSECRSRSLSSSPPSDTPSMSRDSVHRRPETSFMCGLWLVVAARVQPQVAAQLAAGSEHGTCRSWKKTMTVVPAWPRPTLCSQLSCRRMRAPQPWNFSRWTRTVVVDHRDAAGGVLGRGRLGLRGGPGRSRTSGQLPKRTQTKKGAQHGRRTHRARPLHRSGHRRGPVDAEDTAEDLGVPDVQRPRR